MGPTVSDNDRAILITVTARIDASSPDTMFMSLRWYDLDVDDAPTQSLDASDIRQAVTRIEEWLEEFTRRGTPRQTTLGDGSDPGQA